MNQIDILSLLGPSAALPQAPLDGPAGAAAPAPSAEAFMAQLQILLAANGPPGGLQAARLSAPAVDPPPQSGIVWPFAIDGEQHEALKADAAMLAVQLSALLQGAVQEQPAAGPAQSARSEPQTGTLAPDPDGPAAQSAEGLLVKLDTLRRLLPQAGARLAQVLTRTIGAQVGAQLSQVRIELTSPAPSGAVGSGLATTEPERPAMPAVIQLTGEASKLIGGTATISGSESLRWLEGVLASGKQAQVRSLVGNAATEPGPGLLLAGSGHHGAGIELAEGLILTLDELAGEPASPDRQSFLVQIQAQTPESPQISARLTLQVAKPDLLATAEPAGFRPAAINLGAAAHLLQGQPRFPPQLRQLGEPEGAVGIAHYPLFTRALGEPELEAPAPAGPSQLVHKRLQQIMTAPRTTAVPSVRSETARELPSAVVVQAPPITGSRLPEATTARLQKMGQPAITLMPGKAVAVELPAGQESRLTANTQEAASSRQTAVMAAQKATQPLMADPAVTETPEVAPLPEVQRTTPVLPRPLAGPQPEAAESPASAAVLAPQLLQFVSQTPQSAPDYTAALHSMLGRINELAQHYRAAGDGLYNAQLELDPPALGKLFINVLVRGDNVAIQVAAVSPASREQLQAGAAQLRQGLIDSGLNVAEMRIVSLDPDEEQGEPGHGRSSREEGQGGQQGRKSAPRWEPPLKVAGSA